MNITKESIDTLNAKIKIEMFQEDYRPQVDKILKEQQRKATMPGFRPGKVPMGMIQKMYGKSVVLDEVNKILYDSLNKFIEDNKIEALGGPLISSEHFPEFDLDNNSPLEFSFELGLTPDITIDFNIVGSIEHLSITTDDATIEKHVNEIRRKFGKYTSPDICGDGDWLFGEFCELEGAELKENGIIHKSSVFTELIGEEDKKKLFIGLKKGDIIEFYPSEVYNNSSEVAALLGIKKQEAEELKSKFRFTIESIGHVELAELNEELFLKIYPDGDVKTEVDLKAKLNSEYADMYNQESDRKFLNDAATAIIDKTEIELPEAFLKKWLHRTSEKPLTEEQIEIEFPSFVRMLKWQIIESKIIKENNINVNSEDVFSHAKNIVGKQLQQYGRFNSLDEEIENITKRYLQNKEDSKKIYENLFDLKITEVLKKIMKVEEKKISFTEFVKIVQESNKKHEAEHHHEHNEDCDHDNDHNHTH